MSDRPQRRGELVQSPTSDGWTIYDPEADSLHVVNDTARAIWELCDGQTSADEMAEAVAQLTGLDLSAAKEQVSAALTALGKARLIDSRSM